ncbi:C40 family peptidase [Leucobacter sp. CSA1]|uniref:C40 family peptidase n=2 Tax=Leucobacter chromiisoli TaxID=2796471 RepID=A0A934Q3E3_9MICO|nr:C40 family peptidase [Leucobacter chromiisoli]
MVGAAVLSAGLVGTFALPAYATPEVEGQPDYTPAQNLTTADIEAAPLALEGPSAAVSEEWTAAEEARKKAEAEAKAAEERERAAQQADTAAQPAGEAPSGNDIPAGSGGQGIANAALAQLGVVQDCTALVEKSLRAIGVPAGDLGTQVGEYTALGGVQVSAGSYAVGDILIWPGQHVAVYIGNGQAVHGGWNGNQTVVAGVTTSAGAPSAVVRF